ncbi:MAG: efflux RND transporter permease subunit [Saprospiraceae bacterium]|nr:efflux RND transporter permease subunit [Saprospiraceae bacterium]MDW8483325.1 efflux RND transporter permease subunit [Saprospiraceae bacterium]
MNLTALSIRRPSLVIVVFAVLMFMGIASYQRLPIEMTPKFDPPVITVSAIYPGASPAEVENAVARPLEDVVASLEGVQLIQIGSNEGICFIALELSQETDVDRAVQELQRKINQIMPTLPREVRPPVVNKFAFSELPVMRVAVRSQLVGSELYDMVKNRLLPELTQVRGVAQVTLLGGEAREVRVNVRRDRLAQYGLSLLQVVQAIQASNIEFPTGKLVSGDTQVRIRLSGKIRSLEELRRLVVGRSRQGGFVYLGDVADVQDGTKEPEVFCRFNGEPVLALEIRKQGDANAVEMSRLLRQTMKRQEQVYAANGLKYEVISDATIFIRQATNAVLHDLLMAVVLVALVMLLFLHSLRNAAIVLVSIPTSIISTFVMMKVMDYSINMMSLLGLSLSIGILVDDAIVVIENIYRHLEMGKNRAQAAYDGRQEIGYTAISITLVDVVVFLPIIFTTGVVPNLLRQFCMTVLVATLMSLLVSFTLVPWLASRIGKLHRFEGRNWAGQAVLRFETVLERFADWFVDVLKWALRNWKTKAVVLLVVSLLGVGSVWLVTGGFIGNAFIESGERGEFLLEIELPKTASIAQTDAIVREVEHWLQQQQHVVRLFTTVGTTSKSFGLNAPYVAEILVELTPYPRPRRISTDVFARQTKLELEERIAGAQIRANPIDILGLSFSPIEVRINGPNLDSLLAMSDTIMRAMASVPGCVEITPSVEVGNPEVQVVVDRQRMAEYGITMAQLGLTLQAAFSGNTDVRFRDGAYEYPIRVVLDAFDRRSAEDIRNLTLTNPLGVPIAIRQFANVREGFGPTRLERRDRLPSVQFSASVIGRPTGTVAREVKAKVSAIRPPTGAHYQFGGELRRQEESLGTMRFALWTSLVLVYLVMVALYDNWMYPFVVLLSIPLSVIGAFLAMALAQQNLTVFTGLGLLMLVGLVGKNAILVVDFANHLKQRGLGLHAALLQATKLRFRPVLMTNISMIIGLLPLALSTSAGSAWKVGLAWAIIGGLSSSMFLSLIFVPIVYALFDNLLTRVGLNKKEHVEFVEDLTY